MSIETASILTAMYELRIKLGKVAEAGDVLIKLTNLKVDMILHNL